jgi:hypothetical protein
MPAAAPRISAQLVAVMARIDDGKRPIADTHRRVGIVAEHLGLSRPSYEQVRTIVHLIRAERRDPRIGELLLAAAFSGRVKKPILDVIDALSREPF